MNRIRHACRDEQGAVIIQIGLVAFVLMAFNVFVLDYGMMWIARSQAQNAADAGALAGAMARGYDEFDNPPHEAGLASQIAMGVARANEVWGAPATAVVSYTCPTGVSGRCTRIDVHRDGEAGSTAMPTLFGPLLDVATQRVRATATAMTLNGNSTPCLRPLAFADDWLERGSNSSFNRYIESGPNAGDLVPAGDRDEYTPPSASASGRTTVPDDFGERIIWNFDDVLSSAITRHLTVPLELPGGTFIETMRQCNGQLLSLNQAISVDTGIHHRDVTNAINALSALDSAANYDYGQHRITNSCAPGCAPISPRLVPVVLYDPQRFQLGRATGRWTDPEVGCPNSRPCVTVSNIVGLFLHGSVPAFPEPHGHLMRYPGVTVSTAPTFVDSGSWLVTTHLIR
jgi:hypothetical protein